MKLPAQCYKHLREDSSMPSTVMQMRISSFIYLTVSMYLGPLIITLFALCVCVFVGYMYACFVHVGSKKCNGLGGASSSCVWQLRCLLYCLHVKDNIMWGFFLPFFNTSSVVCHPQHFVGMMLSTLRKASCGDENINMLRSEASFVKRCLP